jgi:hypothetical protein
MPTNPSIKTTPDNIVTRLRERARRLHREEQPSTPADVLADVRRLGLETPAEAASIVRADRDRH